MHIQFLDRVHVNILPRRVLRERTPRVPLYVFPVMLENIIQVRFDWNYTLKSGFD